MLNIPLVGFLPGADERVTGTIDAISRELGRDGFVARYSTAETDDGLPGGEGQFLACSFWLVNALALNGRVDEARALFERLLGLSNDLGLLAEEYDVERGRQVGNFPQAFSHLTLIGAAYAIAAAEATATRPSTQASTEGGDDDEDGDRGRSRGGCLDGCAAEAARRVGRDRRARAGPLRLVRELRPALPHRRGDPGARQPAAADAREPRARASRSTCGPDRRCSASIATPRRSRCATSREERTYRESYDKLVLCPGAEPIRPPIPGADDPRVDVLRNIPDMDRIIARLDEDATSAVVVGGSYIGLELTEAFRARGLQTTVVERTERLMPWLDPEMTRILDYHVGTHDVDLRLGTSADGGSPRRRRPARARSLRRHVGRGRRGGDGGRGASERGPRP